MFKILKFIMWVLIVIFAAGLSIAIFSNDDVEPVKVEKQEEQVEVVESVQTPEQIEELKHDEWVNKQFSPWDGSHRALVRLLKENLNDAKSFEHVDTSYIEDGDDLIVTMTYRAKNGFGGMVLETVKAKASYEDDTITVIE